jgi:hypothetical protein
MTRAATRAACRVPGLLLPVLVLLAGGVAEDLCAQSAGLPGSATEWLRDVGPPPAPLRTIPVPLPPPASRVFESAQGVEGHLGVAHPGASGRLLQESGVSPRGAFIRSLLVPGWGHAAADAPGRAAFYVAAQGGTYWMLAKSLIRRGSAVRYRDAEFDLVAAELRASGMTNPDSVQLRAGNDARVERWDELVEIRGDQVEDWLALGIFLSLLGATDALVAAHMADFPEPLTIRVTPAGSPGRGWSLGLSLPLDRRRSIGR